MSNGSNICEFVAAFAPCHEREHRVLWYYQKLRQYTII